MPRRRFRGDWCDTRKPSSLANPWSWSSLTTQKQKLTMLKTLLAERRLIAEVKAAAIRDGTLGLPLKYVIRSKMERRGYARY